MNRTPTKALDEGRKLPPRVAVVSAERQAMYLEAAEVDPALFGDLVDLSVLANDCILQTYPLRPPGMRGLHLGQKMIQYRPIRIGERLEMRGEVAQTGTMGKGDRVDYDIAFADEAGAVVARAEMRSLQVDVEAMSALGGSGAKFYDTIGFEALAEKHPTAERVTGYSAEFPLDKVHFEPEVAAEMGLRAPIAQGLMSLTWMMAALAEGGVPSSIEIDCEFRRPIFWDDRITVMAKGQTEYQIRNQLDEVCSIGRVVQLARPV